MKKFLSCLPIGETYGQYFVTSCGEVFRYEGKDKVIVKRHIKENKKLGDYSYVFLYIRDKKLDQKRFVYLKLNDLVYKYFSNKRKKGKYVYNINADIMDTKISNLKCINKIEDIPLDRKDENIRYFLFYKIFLSYSKKLSYKLRNKFKMNGYDDDMLHSGLIHFFTYHAKYFDLKYFRKVNSEEFKYLDIKKIHSSFKTVKSAKAFFMQRFFNYFSEKNYYGKKYKQSIEMNDIEHKVVAANKSFLFFGTCDIPKNHKDFFYLKLHSSILERSIEDEVYIRQFIDFINKYDSISEKVKKCFVLFIRSLNVKDLGRNAEAMICKLEIIFNKFNQCNYGALKNAYSVC